MFQSPLIGWHVAGVLDRIQALLAAAGSEVERIGQTPANIPCSSGLEIPDDAPVCIGGAIERFYQRAG